MITKEILAEKVLRKLSGGDYSANNKVKRQDVYLEMESAYGLVVQNYLNEYGEDAMGEFITTYDSVTVSKNTNRERLYSVLPAQLVSLDGGRGIRQISGSKDEKNVFIPMNAGDEGLFYGLEAESIYGKVGYWLEGVNVIYKSLPDYYEGKTVMIKMISSIYSLPEDAYIPIPAGLETTFEDEVMKRMGIQKQVPQDKVADNSDK